VIGCHIGQVHDRLTFVKVGRPLDVCIVTKHGRKGKSGAVSRRRQPAPLTGRFPTSLLIGHLLEAFELLEQVSSRRVALVSSF
jgi:hypothetical protein